MILSVALAPATAFSSSLWHVIFAVSNASIRRARASLAFSPSSPAVALIRASASRTTTLRSATSFCRVTASCSNAGFATFVSITFLSTSRADTEPLSSNLPQHRLRLFKVSTGLKRESRSRPEGGRGRKRALTETRRMLGICSHFGTRSQGREKFHFELRPGRINSRPDEYNHAQRGATETDWSHLHPFSRHRRRHARSGEMGAHPGAAGPLLLLDGWPARYPAGVQLRRTARVLSPSPGAGGSGTDFQRHYATA